MYALPIDQSGLAGFIPTERQPNRRQRRAMYAMQPRQRRMPRRIQLPRGLMGGGLIPVIGRQTNGQIFSDELGEADVVSNPMVVEGGYAEPISMPVPEVAIEDYDIESSIPQTVIGEAAFGAGMYPELADQQGNLYAQQSSPLAEQEGRWGASFPDWQSGLTVTTPLGDVGPLFTRTGMIAGAGKSLISRALPGIGSKAAPLVTPAVKAMMGEKVTGKDWTFAGLGLLASFFFPALMPILGLINFVTDLMDPPKTEPESVLQEGVDIPGLAGPIELATSGLGLGITPDVFYNAYAEPGNPYTVMDENIGFGQLPSGWEDSIYEGLSSLPAGASIGELDIGVPVDLYQDSDPAFSSINPASFVEGVPQSHSGNTYFVGHDQGLYDWTMDPFDMDDKSFASFMSDPSGFVPGPYEGDIDFNFAGDFGVDPDGGIYGGEGN